MDAPVDGRAIAADRRTHEGKKTGWLARLLYTAHRYTELGI